MSEQVRVWAEELAVVRVLVPLEQAMPDPGLPSVRRVSMRASVIASSAGRGAVDADLDGRVSRLVSAARAAAARTQELEAALRQ